MKEFKIEKIEKGLPPIKGNAEKIIKTIVSEAESEITESKALENNTEKFYTEN